MVPYLMNLAEEESGNEVDAIDALRMISQSISGKIELGKCSIFGFCLKYLTHPNPERRALICSLVGSLVVTFLEDGHN